MSACISKEIQFTYVSSIYPNPCADQVTISINPGIDILPNSILKVFDADSNDLIAETSELSVFTPFVINMSDRESGEYYVQFFISGELIETDVFIKI